MPRRSPSPIQHPWNVSTAEAREILIAMINAADLSGGTAGSLSALDNYEIYDERGKQIHPDDLEG